VTSGNLFSDCLLRLTIRQLLLVPDDPNNFVHVATLQLDHWKVVSVVRLLLGPWTTSGCAVVVLDLVGVLNEGGIMQPGVRIFDVFEIVL
jgi:hypothetical protein